MSTATEYHVVLACPASWNWAQATMFAERMQEETPREVGVYVWTLNEGKLVDQATMRVQAEVEDD